MSSAHLGDANLKRIINWVLDYFAEQDGRHPREARHVHRVSQGHAHRSAERRNCSQSCATRSSSLTIGERRKKMVAAMEKEFADLGLTFSIGGQISFDVFAEGLGQDALSPAHVEVAGSRRSISSGTRRTRGLASTTRSSRTNARRAKVRRPTTDGARRVALLLKVMEYWCSPSRQNAGLHGRRAALRAIADAMRGWATSGVPGDEFEIRAGHRSSHQALGERRPRA